MKTSPAKEYATSKDVAEVLQLNEATIRLWARQGKIPCRRLGHRTVRFEVDRVLKALESAKK